MDLHPGEEVVYEGHPTWRALLAFYLTGLLAAVVIAVIVALVASVAIGILCFVVLAAVVLVGGFVRRIATTDRVSNQRLYIG